MNPQTSLFFHNRIWFYKLKCHDGSEAPTHSLTKWNFSLKDFTTRGDWGHKESTHDSLHTAPHCSFKYSLHDITAVGFFLQQKTICLWPPLLNGAVSLFMCVRDSPCAPGWPLVGRPAMLLSIFPGSNEREGLKGDKYFVTPVSNSGVWKLSHAAENGWCPARTRIKLWLCSRNIFPGWSMIGLFFENEFFFKWNTQENGSRLK